MILLDCRYLWHFLAIIRVKRNKANIPLWVEINVLKTIENINKYILTILCFFDFKYY